MRDTQGSEFDARRRSASRAFVELGRPRQRGGSVAVVVPVLVAVSTRIVIAVVVLILVFVLVLSAATRPSRIDRLSVRSQDARRWFSGSLRGVVGRRRFARCSGR